MSSLLTMVKSRPNFSRISSCHFSDRLGGHTIDRGPGPVAKKQLLDDEPGLDGLAQADVVGQQQVGAGLARGRVARAQAGRPQRCRADQNGAW
jgi:hypothetical protein